jgi:NADP-dependent 3-hydroxy acid dehydrogenase YdfG
MKQTILITGASSGFGLLTAQKLHESGFQTNIGNSATAATGNIQDSFCDIIVIQ